MRRKCLPETVIGISSQPTTYVQQHLAIADISSPVYASLLVRIDGQKSVVSSSDYRTEPEIGSSVPLPHIFTSWPRS